MCSVAMADVKGFNDITDKGKIDWEAVDASVTAFDSEATRAMVYEFFINNEGREISAKDLLGWCYTISGQGAHLVECTNFVKKYFTYTGGDANNCTMASGQAGEVYAKRLDIGGMNSDVSFKTTLSACETYGHCSSYGPGGCTEDHSLMGESGIYEVCRRFLENVKKCTRHLESYYAKELSKTDLDAKKKKQYSCILNLVQTGQLELPMNLMEKKCK
jgi:hypothetical protein